MTDPQEKKLRDVVVSLSKKLNAAETNEFVYTYRLPQEYNGKAPLTVLQTMHQRGLFSATKPEELAKLMKELNRMDLVQTVQDELIKKKTRKKAKPADSAGSQSPSVSASMQAKLEVSDIQSHITAKALNQTLEMVKETPQLKRLEEVLLKAKHEANQLCSLIKHAQELYDLYAKPGTAPQAPLPPTPNEQASDDDDGIYYSQPWFSDREKTPTKESIECDSDGYMCMDDVPDEVTDTKQPAGTQMVTGVSANKTKPKKPATRPKPAKQRLDGSICKSKTLPPSTRKQPAIGADDIQKGKSMLRRASGTKLPLESSDGGFDDADCTGGSCTGEDTSTGDSGFGDVGPLMKVKPVRKPQPTVQPDTKPIATDNYYKRLGTPDYIDYYSTVTTKESNDNGPDGVYAIARNSDGAIYANLLGTVKQHRT